MASQLRAIIARWAACLAPRGILVAVISPGWEGTTAEGDVIAAGYGGRRRLRALFANRPYKAIAPWWGR